MVIQRGGRQFSQRWKSKRLVSKCLLSYSKTMDPSPGPAKSFSTSLNLCSLQISRLLYSENNPLSKLVCAYSVASDSVTPAWRLCSWHFSGKNTGVGCQFLLQGILLTQGSNEHLLHPLQGDVKRKTS